MPTQKNRERIAVFHLAFLYSGGGEKLVLKEVELLKKAGYDVDIYAPLVDTTECFPDLIKKYSIRELFPGFTRIFRKKPEIGVMIACILFPFISWGFRKYDLVFSANQPSLIFGYMLKLLYKKKYIAYLAQPTRIIYPRPIDKIHGLKLKNKMRILPHIVNIFRPIFFWIDLKSIINADVFLCNGKYMQDILSNIYGVQPIICSAGTEIESVKRNRYKATMCNNEVLNVNNTQIQKPYLLISNRHFPQKKFEYAIEILEQCNSSFSLVITGEPTSYSSEILALAEYYNIRQKVLMLGYVDEIDLKTIYRNASIYLYTAPEEDFGMGVIESMGYGIPVLAWNKAGPSRIIKNEHTGFLLDFANTDSCVCVINKLASDEQLYNTISKNAAEEIISRYTWKNHLRILQNNIQSLTTQHVDEIQVSNIDALTKLAE